MGPIDRVVVQGVTRSFGATAALRGIDACFRRGEITTLEGHNGSGKSTLLGILGTVIPPTTGRITYGSNGAPGLSTSEIRSQIGWVSHESHCYPDLSARQNLRLTASLYGVEPAGAWNRASQRFGMESFADTPVRLLSRGQRQRVALARALVHAPALLLLDEPTTGLDPEGIERLLDAVAEEVARGCMVIFVTHDSAIAERIATQRLRLERGRLKA